MNDHVEQTRQKFLHLAERIPTARFMGVVSVDGLSLLEWRYDLTQKQMTEYIAMEESRISPFSAAMLSLGERIAGECTKSHYQFEILEAERGAVFNTILGDELTFTFGFHDHRSVDEPLVILQQQWGDLLAMFNVKPPQLWPAVYVPPADARPPRRNPTPVGRNYGAKMSSKNELIRQQLMLIAERITTTYFIALVGVDGVQIMELVTDDSLEVARVAAMSEAMSNLGERITTELGLGVHRSTVVRGAEGTVFMVILGDEYILTFGVREVRTIDSVWVILHQWWEVLLALLGVPAPTQR